MTPDGFEARVNYWRGRLRSLGLAHWQFEYKFDFDKDEDYRGRDAQATVRVHESYDTAYWVIPRPSLELSPEEIDHIILHELMHVAMRDVNKVEHEMMMILGGREGDVYEEALTHAIEGLVERLARSFFDVGRNLVP